MLKQAHETTQRTTFLAPVVSVAADLSFHELPYSPSLLLPLPDLSSALVCDREFVDACEAGYESYFDEMVNRDFTFVHKNYTSAKVYRYILQNAFAKENPRYATSPSWRVGFVFGWLSALSKYQPTMASVGVNVLCSRARQ